MYSKQIRREIEKVLLDIQMYVRKIFISNDEGFLNIENMDFVESYPDSIIQEIMEDEKFNIDFSSPMKCEVLQLEPGEFHLELIQHKKEFKYKSNNNCKKKKEVKPMKNKIGLQRLETAANNNVRERIIPEVNTDQDFMNFAGSIHGEFLQDDINVGVGMQTVVIDTFSAILAIEDDTKFVKVAKRALSHCESLIEAYGDINALNGTDVYIPVREYNGNLHGKDFKFVVISEGVENTIFNQIEKMDLDNASNLRALLRDLNDCGRMYQELTLDAAKKLYEVHASFYQEMLRAESTIHINHNFDKFKNITEEKQFCISRKRYDVDRMLEVGEMQDFYKRNGDIKKIIVKDNLADIQNDNMEAVEYAVNTIGKNAYDNTNLSVETIADLNLTGESGRIAMDLFEFIIKPYNKAIAEKARKTEQINEDVRLTDFERATYLGRLDDEQEDMKNTLSNLARFFTKDLTMVEAGRAMFTASNIYINGKESKPVLKEDTSSTAWMHIAPELGFAYITAIHADIKVCGYKLLGNTDQVIEGDSIEFANGNAVGFNNLYIDDVFSGTLKVQVIDEVLSVVMDINELLEANRVPHTTPDKISLRIYEGSTIDCQHFARTGEVKWLRSHTAFDAQGVFEKADSITLYPVYRYKDSHGKERRLFNTVVATVPRKDDPSIKLELPACGYLCYSATFEKIFAGLTFDNIEKNNNIDGKTAWAKVSYGTYVEVEKRLSVPNNTLETGEVAEYKFNNEIAVNASDDAFASKTPKVTNEEELVFLSAFGDQSFEVIEEDEFNIFG